MKTIIIPDFSPATVCSNWVDYDVSFSAILNWTLVERKTGMALGISDKSVPYWVKLLKQASTLKPQLP